jgi:type I restriction enzyme R subunit
VELLERLLEGEIKSRFASNVVQDKQVLRAAGQRDPALPEPRIETAQVMEELVAMAKKFREASPTGASNWA